MFEKFKKEKSPEAVKNISAQDKPADILPDNIYTMPEKFRKSSSSSSSNNTLIIGIGAVLIIVVMAVTGGYVYLTQQKKITANIESVGNGQEKENNQSTSIAPNDQENSENKSSANLENKKNTDEKLTEPTPVISEPVTNSVLYVSSFDADKDGLTDTEERLYGLNENLPDFDQDGYIDGEELSSFYDPKKGDGAKLGESGLMAEYKNPSNNFSLFYPVGWVAQAVQATNEYIFTANDSEFISVKIEDNIDKLTSLDWYSAKKPGADLSKIKILNLSGWDAILSEDGMQAYLTAKDGDGKITGKRIFVISYSANSSKEINYLTTFRAIIKSVNEGLEQDGIKSGMPDKQNVIL